LYLGPSIQREIIVLVAPKPVGCGQHGKEHPFHSRLFCVETPQRPSSLKYFGEAPDRTTGHYEATESNHVGGNSAMHATPTRGR